MCYNTLVSKEHTNQPKGDKIMETLKIFINQCIRYAHHPYGEPKDFMQQAFGAVQFFMMEHPDQSNEAADLWEEVRPKFFED